jgi:hypothetical protein
MIRRSAKTGTWIGGFTRTSAISRRRLAFRSTCSDRGGIMSARDRVLRDAVRAELRRASSPSLTERTYRLVTWGALVVVLLVLLAACPRSDPVVQGRVTSLTPTPGRTIVQLTIRYPDGHTARRELTRGLCVVGDEYPRCTEGR